MNKYPNDPEREAEEQEDVLFERWRDNKYTPTSREQEDRFLRQWRATPQADF